MYAQSGGRCFGNVLVVFVAAGRLGGPERTLQSRESQGKPGLERGRKRKIHWWRGKAEVLVEYPLQSQSTGHCPRTQVGLVLPLSADFPPRRQLLWYKPSWGVGGKLQ